MLNFPQRVVARTRLHRALHRCQQQVQKMATPKKVEFMPQKGILVNPYNVSQTKEEEPSDFMVDISYLLLYSENSTHRYSWHFHSRN